MSYRKSEETLGMTREKAPPIPWSAGGESVRRWGRELDTADRRLEELEEAFGEEQAVNRRRARIREG